MKYFPHESYSINFLTSGWWLCYRKVNKWSSMRALHMFSHPMAQYSLPPNLQLLLFNKLLLPSQSTNKLKSQRVQKIRTEISRRALAKLPRLSLLLPKNNNLQCLVKTRIYSQPLLKINRFSKQLLQILTPLVLLRSSLPTSSLL